MPERKRPGLGGAGAPAHDGERARGARRQAELGEAAVEVLGAMRAPASAYERPGYWLEAVLVLLNGHEVVDVLLRAKAVRRGGTPSPVPAEVSRAYPRQTRAHDAIVARPKAEGAAPYPSAGRHLSLTPLGWRISAPQTARGASEKAPGTRRAATDVQARA